MAHTAIGWANASGLPAASDGAVVVAAAWNGGSDWSWDDAPLLDKGIGAGVFRI